MKIIVNDQEINAVYGETLLETTRKAGIQIPTLCYHEAFGGEGRCRLCMVEIEKDGQKKVVASCTYPVTAEISVRTSTPVIEKIRRNIIMLLYKRASGSPLLQDLFRDYGCTDNSLQEDLEERCILCNICVKACEEIGSSAISLIMRGTDKKVATPYDQAAEACIGCGTCARVCPTEAIEMVEDGKQRTIWNKTFELVACERCGKPFATREELAHLAGRNKTIEYDTQLCENCRKKNIADKIKQYTCP